MSLIKLLFIASTLMLHHQLLTKNISFFNLPASYDNYHQIELTFILEVSYLFFVFVFSYSFSLVIAVPIVSFLVLMTPDLLNLVITHFLVLLRVMLVKTLYISFSLHIFCIFLIFQFDCWMALILISE